MVSCVVFGDFTFVGLMVLRDESLVLVFMGAFFSFVFLVGFLIFEESLSFVLFFLVGFSVLVLSSSARAGDWTRKRESNKEVIVVSK